MEHPLTRAQAAELLGISVSGVGYLRRRGDLVFLTDGRGRVRVPRAEVLALRAERESYVRAS